jgi:hypothetical protein
MYKVSVAAADRDDLVGSFEQNLREEYKKSLVEEKKHKENNKSFFQAVLDYIKENIAVTIVFIIIIIVVTILIIKKIIKNKKKVKIDLGRESKKI